MRPERYASHPVPSLKDWQEVWATWDTVTLGMTPVDEFLSKPIKLRNDLIFYLGHIPAFCGIVSAPIPFLIKPDDFQIYKSRRLPVASI
jgi:hypothetical protein